MRYFKKSEFSDIFVDDYIGSIFNPKTNILTHIYNPEATRREEVKGLLAEETVNRDLEDKVVIEITQAEAALLFGEL